MSETYQIIKDKALRVKNLCVNLIRASDQRSLGDWDDVCGACDYFGDTAIALCDLYEGWENDVTFIEFSAKWAASGWETTIIAIDALLKECGQFNFPDEDRPDLVNSLKSIVERWRI